MRFYKIIVTVIFILVLVMTAVSCNKKENEDTNMLIYVSADGSDEGDGSQDSPYSSIEKAIQKIEELLPLTKNIYIIVCGKHFSSGIALAQNIDTGNYKITFEGQNATFSGGIDILVSDFADVTDIEISYDLDWNKIKCIDLKNYGIEVSPAIAEVGFSEEFAISSYELFYNGTAMNIARYPNDNYLKSVGGGSTYETSVITDIDKERLSVWSQQEGGYIRGFFYHDWADDTVKIDNIDPDSGALNSHSYTSYGVRKNARYYVYNYLSELDTEGEWYLDRENNILYAILPENADGSITMSLSDNNLVSLEDVSGIAFKNITFEGSRANLININGSSDISFDNCTFRYAGVMGISAEKATKIKIRNCTFYETGLQAILIKGGDRATLTSSENEISYSTFTKTSRNVSSIQAVRAEGVGCLITHNYFYNLPHSAINFTGNYHMISYNEIENVCYLTADSGAIYTGRNYTFGGNRIEYNYIHDMKANMALGASDIGMGTTAVYIDDIASGITVFGNIFARVARGVLLGGGKNNTIENNVFIDSIFSISADNRGETWEIYLAENNILEIRLFDTSLDIRNSQLWQTSFPYLAELIAQYDNQDYASIHAPSNNVIRYNISTRLFLEIVNTSVSKNGIYQATKYYKPEDIFTNSENREYIFKEDCIIENFTHIPFLEIGVK